MPGTPRPGTPAERRRAAGERSSICTVHTSASLRFAGRSAGGGRGGRDAGADAPRDHRPRPDRGGAAGPRRWRRRADRDRRRGVQDGRRRPHRLFLERAGGAAPAGPRRRSRRSARRAGWWASRTRSTGSAARCSGTRSWSAIAPARRLGRGAQRAPHRRRRQRARRSSSPGRWACPASPSRDAHSVLEVGVAYSALDGDPSTPEGLLAALTDRSSSSPAAPPMSCGPSRPSPSSSSAPGATAGAAALRRAATRAHRDERASRARSQRPGPARRRPTRRPTTPPERRLVRRANAGLDVDGGAAGDVNRAMSRRARCRSAPACGSRRRSSRSSCRWSCIVLCSWASTGIQARRAARPHRRREPGARCSSPFLVFYLGFPLRGLRWAMLLRRHRLPDRGQRRDRDHLHLVAGQLPRARQARRLLPRVPAEDQQRRVR